MPYYWVREVDGRTGEKSSILDILLVDPREDGTELVDVARMGSWDEHLFSRKVTTGGDVFIVGEDMYQEKFELICEIIPPIEEETKETEETEEFFQIDPRCIILNILQLHEQMDLSQLMEFAVEFKKRVHNAYVDICDNSVYGAIEANPNVFTLKGTTISRSQEFGKFGSREFLDETINREFPDKVKKHLKEVSESIKSELNKSVKKYFLTWGDGSSMYIDAPNKNAAINMCKKGPSLTVDKVDD